MFVVFAVTFAVFVVMVFAVAMMLFALYQTEFRVERGQFVYVPARAAVSVVLGNLAQGEDETHFGGDHVVAEIHGAEDCQTGKLVEASSFDEKPFESVVYDGYAGESRGYEGERGYLKCRETTAVFADKRRKKRDAGDDEADVFGFLPPRRILIPFSAVVVTAAAGTAVRAAVFVMIVMVVFVPVAVVFPVFAVIAVLAVPVLFVIVTAGAAAFAVFMMTHVIPSA